MKKSAFTLIELLVYMAIMGFIIVVAGRVFSDSASMRVRSQNMLKSAEQVGKISDMLREDISQMGAKVGGYGKADGNEFKYEFKTADNKIYWKWNDNTPDANDSSSYSLTQSETDNDKIPYDKLVFRKAVFDEDGKYIGVREIAWEASGNVQNGNGKLERKCATIQSCAGSECSPIAANDDPACPKAADINAVVPVIIAENIAGFRITPSQPGKNDDNGILFGDSDSDNKNFRLLQKEEAGDRKLATVSPSGGNSTSSTISGFNNNQSEQGKDYYELYLAKGSEDNCMELSFKEKETYVIEFEMPFFDDKSTQFQPGKDHLAIGLRNSNGGKIPSAPKDMLFYPPQDKNVQSKKTGMEFSFSAGEAASEDIKSCVAITLAFYSKQAHEGKFQFKNFKVFRKSDESFRFLKEGDEGYTEGYGIDGDDNSLQKRQEKKRVKAFEIKLEVANRGEKAGTYSNEKGMVITTPNNGIVPTL